jgi:hypothetical protein
MAKVIAPFKIVGTLDDLNFYLDENKINRVRTKGKTGVTSEEFKKNPIFTKVKNHGKEFGKAVKIAQKFRTLAHYFNNRAKDGSFAGRGNKLILEIIQEDKINPHGERTFENGLKEENVKNYFLNFEGNKLRPLNKIAKIKWNWDEEKSILTIKNPKLDQDIMWPEKADNIHLAIARTNWNYLENKFETNYSEEIIMKKEAKTKTIELKVEKPKEEELQLVFLFIGFSIQERNKTKELKRANNTLSIIWSK